MTTTAEMMSFTYSSDYAAECQNTRRTEQSQLGIDNPRYNNMDWPQLHMLYPVIDALEAKHSCNVVMATALSSEPEAPSQFLNSDDMPGNPLVIAHNTRLVQRRGLIPVIDPPPMRAIQDMRVESCPDYYREFLSDGHRLGLIAPRLITIPWWWYSHNSTPEQLEQMYTALDSAFSEALDPTFEAEYAASTSLRIAEHVEGLLNSRGSEQLNSLREEVPTLVEQLARYERQTAAWQMRLDELRGQIRAAEDAVIQIDDIASTAQTEIEAINAHPDVTSIDRGDNASLVIFTNELPLENIDSGDVTVGGSYRITIHFGRDAALEVKNLTHAVGSYDHPHVSSGTFCLGDQRRMVDSLLARSELSAAINLIIDLLKQVNPDDTYTSDWAAWFDLD